MRTVALATPLASQIQRTMGYPFAIVRIKKSLAHTLPLTIHTTGMTPLGGPFDALTRARMREIISEFPFARRFRERRDRFEIEAPGGGRLEVWLTSDGNLFIDSQAGLELTLALYLELRRIAADIAIEDPQRGVLHSEASFKDFMCGEETAPQRRPYAHESAA